MHKKKKTIYIKNELKEQIEKLSQIHNISFSQAIICILNNYFNKTNKNAK